MSGMTAHRIELDELVETDPEPCPSCAGGIRWMLCDDGEWRCRNCVTGLASANGWDQPPTVAEPETEALRVRPQPVDNPVDAPLDFGDSK